MHGVIDGGLFYSNSTRRRVPTSAEVRDMFDKLGDDDDDNYGVSKVTRKKRNPDYDNGHRHGDANDLEFELLHRKHQRQEAMGGKYLGKLGRNGGDDGFNNYIQGAGVHEEEDGENDENEEEEHEEEGNEDEEEDKEDDEIEEEADRYASEVDRYADVPMGEKYWGKLGRDGGDDGFNNYIQGAGVHVKEDEEVDENEEEHEEERNEDEEDDEEDDENEEEANEEEEDVRIQTVSISSNFSCFVFCALSYYYFFVAYHVSGY
jgi:hypothetical protein